MKFSCCCCCSSSSPSRPCTIIVPSLSSPPSTSSFFLLLPLLFYSSSTSHSPPPPSSLSTVFPSLPRHHRPLSQSMAKSSLFCTQHCWTYLNEMLFVEPGPISYCSLMCSVVTHFRNTHSKLSGSKRPFSFKLHEPVVAKRTAVIIAELWEWVQEFEYVCSRVSACVWYVFSTASVWWFVSLL